MRIVSLCPSVTELLCDLGAGAELVGVTRYLSAVVRNRRILAMTGYRHHPRAERVTRGARFCPLGSPDRGRLRSMASVESQRLFRCEHCDRGVSICRSCDRGQRYCSRDCSRQARLKAHREANRRYQATARGRELHRRRQARYRARRQAVTDHSVRRRPTTVQKRPQPPQRGFCCVCDDGPVNFYRLDALRDDRRATRRRRRRRRPPPKCG